MELDFDKYCVIDGSPTTVLRAPRNPSKAANKDSSFQPKRIDNSSRLSKDFREFSFNRYRSASCRDARSLQSNEECNNNASLRKRGSVYQSSKEVSFLKKNDSDVVSERKKIEFSRGAVSEISFGIIDSLCISDENRLSSMSRSEQCTASSSCKNRIEFMSESVSPHSSQEREADIALRLPKSLSSRTALSHSDTINSGPISPKVRFNSSEKTIDPYVKSKYHRSPLSSVNRTSSETTSADTSMACEDSNDMSVKPHLVEVKSTSPAHLNGILKIDNKHGFEFSVKSPEELHYLAKTWRVENDPNRVYTFHSLHPRRRKSNASGWGHRDSYRESAVLGQMHASYYRCNESNGSGTAHDKMVTEFVLYDVSHSRRSDTSSRGEDTQSKYSRDITDDSRLSHSKPIPSSDLHPVQEIAAIVIEAPVEKRESLKFKTCNKGSVQPLPSLLELCQMERANEGSSDISTRGTALHVVVPCGQHGSPSGESTRGPNLLLARWRLGGRCDCGGWDMACPLNIFRSSIDFSIPDGPKLMNDRNPAEIFSLGKKDDVPAFTMRKIEDGKYAVNFHAQLSSLQAFSICVAILHSSADKSTVVVERDRIIRKQTLHQSDSLRVFPEEEIDNLIDTPSAAEEEKLKLHKKNEKQVLTNQSFVVNPPFSPIARV